MRTSFLRTLGARLEAALAAVAFAEEREVEAARALLAQVAERARGGGPAPR